MGAGASIIWGAWEMALTQAEGLSGAPGGGLSLDTISAGLFRSLGNMSSVLTSSPGSSGSGSGAFGGGGSSGGGGGSFSGGGGGGGFRAG